MAQLADRQTASTWAADNPEDLSRWIQKARDLFMHDTSIRVPRTVEDRRHGFRQWLTNYRDRLESLLARTFSLEFPQAASQLADYDQFRQIYQSHVWPEIEPEVRLYAIRGMANWWASHHLGDAVIRHWPEPIGRNWRIPLSVSGAPGILGQIVLDSNGDVIEKQTSTHEELLRKTHAADSERTSAAR